MSAVDTVEFSSVKIEDKAEESAVIEQWQR
jgi:hypothetical protein